MAALPYIQLYVADYLADTAHLTAAQNGAYLLLIFNYWQRGKPLDNRNERLANVARMSNEEWQQNKEIIADFFVVDGDTWHHTRIDADLDEVLKKSTKSSAAGKASAAKRNQKRNERSTDVEQTVNHKDKDTELTSTDVEVVVSESLPTCPHQEIITLFGELLPELPQPRVWEGNRRDHLASRWKWVIADLRKKDMPADRQAGIDFFRRMFEYIGKRDMLMGRNGGWSCSLPWIVKAENFAKIIEGNYEKTKGAA